MTSTRSLPLLVLAITACAAYFAASFVPYRVDTDIGFQLRSVQQWARGESPSPATLRLPDPADLSRDRLVWSNWWPPGLPFLYAPLVALGLPLGTAVRATSLLLFLVGSAGWLQLSARVELPRWAAVLYALSLLAYGLSLGGAATLRTGDQIAYAAGPWVALLALRRSEAAASAGGLFLCGLALGATYWLRYSLFVAALPLLAFVAVRTFTGAADRPQPARLGRIALLGLGFALPVAALLLLNVAFSDNLTESLTGTRSAWDISRDSASRPFALATSFLGSPGLALFQSDLWLTHLTSFSDRLLPFLRGLGNGERIVIKSLLAVPLTGLLLWSLLRARRRLPGPLPSLALVATAGFFLALTAISIGVRYNYLGNEAARFAAGFMPMVHPLVLAAWLTPDLRMPDRRLDRALGAAILALLAAQVLFSLANFLKNDLYDRRALPYTAASTGLFTPEIARDVPAVQATVAALLRSPRDAVLVAGPVGWGSAFIMWLELPGRVLPVATFYEPLGARYLDAASLRGTRPYATRSPLRVVLVVSRTLLEDGWLGKLQARFPQAGQWQTAPTPDAAVVISYSDLETDER